MSFDSGTLLILEDGVLHDRTSLIHDDTPFSFDNTRGRRGTSSVPLMILAASTYLPKVGWPVFIQEVYQGSPVTTERVFLGVVSMFDWEYFNDAGDRIVILSVVSLEKWFDSIQTPPLEFTSTDAGTIFTAIFNAVISKLPSGVALSLGTIDAGVSISKRSYTGNSNAASDLQQLATDSAFIWYIDPRDAKIYFHAHDTRPASFTVTSADIYVEAGKSSLKWTVSDADFRDRQLIQQTTGGVSTVPPLQATFVGDGTHNTYMLPSAPSAVIAAQTSTGKPGISTATFSANPTAGDTITLAGVVYTFVSMLTNTTANQVLIGGTLSDALVGLADGINALQGNPSAGVAYSNPTVPNPFITAQLLGADKVVLTALQSGPSTVTVSTTSGAITFDHATLFGGAGSGVTGISCGVAGTGQFQLTYTVGSATINLLTNLDDGVTLTVWYQPMVPGLIATANATASSLGVASQFRQDAASATVDAATAIQQAAAKLAAYSVLPKVMTFTSDTPGLFCGQFVPVALTEPPQAAAILNGNWLVQDVKGDWIAGAELNAPPFLCHFRYTYTLINTTEISTYQDTLLQLLSTGPFSLTSAAQPKPNPTTSPQSSGGGVGSGSATMTAGQQWVQEQLGLAILNSGDDLVMVTGSTVSSSSYAFQSTDKVLVIAPGTAGWTAGNYPITSVTAGVATIVGSPASSGATGGPWGSSDGLTYQFTWAPAISFWTNNPIAILMVATGNGDSPLTFKTRQLDPFAYADIGFTTGAPAAAGPDYQILSSPPDQVKLRDPLSDGQWLLTEYFPEKPTKLPHKHAGDPPPPVFVAAVNFNAGHAVMSSPDAITWTLQSTAFDNGRCCAATAGKYVVGLEFNSNGGNHQIATSSNGTSWTTRTSPADGNVVQAVEYGGGNFVAIWGSGGDHIMRSTDGGATWSASTIPVLGTGLKCLTYSPGLSLWVAITESGGFVITSSDGGATWTLAATVTGMQPVQGVAWGNSTFVTVGGVLGSGEDTWTSPDGTAWTRQGTPSSNNTWFTVVFGGGKFVAAGDVPLSGSQLAGATTNGVSWSTGGIGSRDWESSTFGLGLYVVAANDDPGGTDMIATSPDGTAWTTQTTPSVANLQGICFGG